MSRNPRALLRSAGALRLAAQGREQGISFSFAGAKAVTADKHLHAVAQDRLASGEDEDLVRRDAAWFRGRYDGLIYPDTDVYGRSCHNSYVIFEPSQLRVIDCQVESASEVPRPRG